MQAPRGISPSTRSDPTTLWYYSVTSLSFFALAHWFPPTAPCDGLGTLPGSSPLYTLNSFRSNYYNSCPHRLLQGAPYASRSSSSTTHAMNYYTHLHAHTEDVRRRHHYSPLVSLSRLKILNDQLPTVDSRH